MTGCGGGFVYTAGEIPHAVCHEIPPVVALQILIQGICYILWPGNEAAEETVWLGFDVSTCYLTDLCINLLQYPHRVTATSEWLVRRYNIIISIHRRCRSIDRSNPSLTPPPPPPPHPVRRRRADNKTIRRGRH